MGNLQTALDDIIPVFEKFEGEVQSLLEKGVLTSAPNQVALIVLVVIGFLLAFLGLKTLHVWGAAFGMLIGTGIGYAGALYLGLDSRQGVIAALIAGVIFAVLGGVFEVLAGFFIAVVLITYTGITIINPKSMMFVVICLAIGILVSLLGIKFRKTVAIIASSVGGGMVVGASLSTLLVLDWELYPYIIGVVVMLLGVIVQFFMLSKKLNKKIIKKAEAIKKEVSVENDIENARNVLDGEAEESTVISNIQEMNQQSTEEKSDEIIKSSEQIKDDAEESLKESEEKEV